MFVLNWTMCLKTVRNTRYPTPFIQIRILIRNPFKPPSPSVLTFLINLLTPPLSLPVFFSLIHPFYPTPFTASPFLLALPSNTSISSWWSICIYLNRNQFILIKLTLSGFCIKYIDMPPQFPFTVSVKCPTRQQRHVWCLFRTNITLNNGGCFRIIQDS